MDTWSSAWLALLVIFSGGLVAGKLSGKPRIPDVAAFLLYGILIGPALLNWVSEPSRSQVNQFVLNLGATLILFDGGRSVELSMLRKVWVSVSLLATTGVFVTTATVAAAAHFALGTPWILSLLTGSILASTDPATLIPVFRRVPVISQLRQTVESESAFNDAISSVLAVTLMAVSASGARIHWGAPVLGFFLSAGVGLGVGLFMGLLCLFLVSTRAWGGFHEYGSLVMLVTAMASYEVSSLLHGSGFMAAFAAGIVAGDGRTFRWELARHTQEHVDHFGNAITLIMRMVIFVLLGTQVDFHLVFRYLWAGLIIVAVLMFVARPLTVLSSVLIDRRAAWRRRDIAFMCWVRETGVIPAALAGLLLGDKVPGAPVVNAITFMAILLTILAQASSTGIVAQWLGVTTAAGPEEEI